MNTAIEQYALETSWSTRITDEIVLEAIQGQIPFEMELKILETITDLNRGKKSNKEIYIKMFSILLKDKVAKPIQAIATQLGHGAGIEHSARAFEWGILLIKECKDVGIYTFLTIDNEWYVHPSFLLVILSN